jgi:formylglycine-generating enzyme required for sulfatase activity
MVPEQRRRDLVGILAAAVLVAGCGEPPPPSVKAGAQEVNSLGMALAWVPPGEYRMKAGNFSLGEDPLVKVERAYRIGVHEVTQEEYEGVMGENPSESSGPRHPVEQVTYAEAEEFCRRLTEREQEAGRLGEDRRYRLPTEAEWVWAAIAGDKDTPRGQPDDLDEVGWHIGNAGKMIDWDRPGGKPAPADRAGTHPVGLLRANAWGLHDMLGNVAEWCQDQSKTWPVGKSGELARAVHGGGWNAIGSHDPWTPFPQDPEDRGRARGFRVVLDTTETPQATSWLRP